jgi:hypothetical protein
MLPRASSVKQMKRLRKKTKSDIGDITTKSSKLPNITFIGNPMDKHVDTYEEFAAKDSQLQTIAFKSKLVNKPLVKNENKKDMSDKIQNLLNFEDFDKEMKTEKLPAPKTKRTDVAKDVIKEKTKTNKTFNFNDFLNEDIDEIEELEELASDDDEFSEEEEAILDDEATDDDKLHKLSDFADDIGEEDEDEVDEEYDDDDDVIIRRFDFEEDDIEDIQDEEDDIEDIQDEEEDIEDIQDEEDGIEDEEDGIEDEEDVASNYADLYNDVLKFESFHLKEVTPKKKEMPKYTMLGEEQELESDPNFGVAAVKDKDNRKIAWFDTFVIDPSTPKERPVLNAGQFIDNDIVKGYVNRIEGKNVYIESLDDPLTIKKFSLKDAVKIKKEE